MTEQAEQVTQTAQNSGKTQTSLEIRHLVKRYANADKPVLDDISFDVPHGKVFVIVGPSGSGKSTLLRTIAGLEPIQGGTIALNGEIIETGKPGTESAGRSKRGSVQLITALSPDRAVHRAAGRDLFSAEAATVPTPDRWRSAGRRSPSTGATSRRPRRGRCRRRRRRY